MLPFTAESNWTAIDTNTLPTGCRQKRYSQVGQGPEFVEDPGGQ